MREGKSFPHRLLYNQRSRPLVVSRENAGFETTEVSAWREVTLSAESGTPSLPLSTTSLPTDTPSFLPVLHPFYRYSILSTGIPSLPTSYPSLLVLHPHPSLPILHSSLPILHPSLPVLHPSYRNSILSYTGTPSFPTGTPSFPTGTPSILPVLHPSYRYSILPSSQAHTSKTAESERQPKRCT